MDSARIVRPKPRKQLIWIFICLSAGTFLGMIGGMAFIFKNSAESEIVDYVEKSSVLLARSISNQLWPNHGDFVTNVPTLNVKALQSRPEIDVITKDLRSLIMGLSILKVRIYNLDGLTLYSTQRNQIGESKSRNIGFVAAAIRGVPNSRYSMRDQFSAISGEKFDVAVVESYVPVHGADGKIKAVFEIYTDVTNTAARLDSRSQHILMASVVIFLLGFGGFLFLVCRANAVIESQNRELFDAHEDLVEKNRRLIEVNAAKSDFLPELVMTCARP
jgi:two-component system, sensor histidine kinase